MNAHAIQKRVVRYLERQKAEVAILKNSLGDLNNHLFAQLERLGDEELKGEKLDEEINRAKAISQVSVQIISTGKLVLDAIKMKDEYLGGDSKRMPAMLRESLVS